MARYKRITRFVVVAAGALALAAPAAQAHPAGSPMAGTGSATVRTQLPPDRADGIGTSRQPVVQISSPAVSPASESGFDWGDASIGAAFATVLVGLGITGVRLGQRRTAQA